MAGWGVRTYMLPWQLDINRMAAQLTSRQMNGRNHRHRKALGRVICLVAIATTSVAVDGHAQAPFTRADTLRGSNGPARAWWDVTYYDLQVRIDPSDSTIVGSNAITYRVVAAPDVPELQIDLQSPLVIDSVTMGRRALPVRREGAAHFVSLLAASPVGAIQTVTVHYGGHPTIAANPPWDGGFIWTSDAAGRPWVATANQGLGASVWWPNKDFQEEEPDSQRIRFTVPDPLKSVSNGRLRGVTSNADGTSTYDWFVGSPINNYAIAVNVGSFTHWQEVYNGLEGPLTLDFWPLEENEAAARRQWTQTAPMLRCFEEWFGPYPWYEDGFKMIESPHLGMEHQSAIAYGNGYQNGYLGRDLSGTGQGLTWDFIIIHEAAHEWWGNNVTTKDVADMWVHESFANYAENLYVECLTGSKAAGAEYVIGTRDAILNDEPIIGEYGVQNQGSGDMYYKGGNMLHVIRQLVNDDARWRSVLRGLQSDFARRTVTTAEVESYIEVGTGVFDQYLRTTRVPALEWSLEGTTLSYRWADVVDGFRMPIPVQAGPDATIVLTPGVDWREVQIPPGVSTIVPDPDFYVASRRVR